VVEEVVMMVSEEDGDVLDDFVFDFFATGVGKLPVIPYVDCRSANAVE
jgi:hypothetical protein